MGEIESLIEANAYGWQLRRVCVLTLSAHDVVTAATMRCDTQRHTEG